MTVEEQRNSAILDALCATYKANLDLIVANRLKKEAEEKARIATMWDIAESKRYRRNSK